MIELSPRLKMAADYVREGSVVCDIGTDHAYLPAYLIINQKISKALAADLRKGPLSNAEKTLFELGISDKIKLRLSDGLDSINPDEAEDIIICGMGGTLIAKILERTQWIKNKRYRLILQPQSHSEEVRYYLISNGFEIIDETACVDDGRMYNCMAAEYKDIRKQYPVSYIYIGKLLEEKSGTGKKIIEKNLKYLKTVADNEYKFKSKEKAKELYEAISEIEEKL